MTGITREELGLHQRWAEVAILEQKPVTTINAVVLHELCRRALIEQSRIDEAVAKERERCAGVADACAHRQERLARNASKVGRGTTFAAWSGGRQAAEHIAAAIRTPTPTTEEGA